MKLSEHVSYNEGVKSNKADINNIDNTPNTEQLERMILICKFIFEPLRVYFNVPIYISSFFRCLMLNKLVNGSKPSQHKKGEAMDLNANIYGVINNLMIFNFIKDNLVFDQLIWELGNDNEPGWIHVSYSNVNNRNQVLRSYKINDEIVYKAA